TKHAASLGLPTDARGAAREWRGQLCLMRATGPPCPRSVKDTTAPGGFALCHFAVGDPAPQFPEGHRVAAFAPAISRQRGSAAFATGRAAPSEPHPLGSSSAARTPVQASARFSRL